MEQPQEDINSLQEEINIPHPHEVDIEGVEGILLDEDELLDDDLLEDEERWDWDLD